MGRENLCKLALGAVFLVTGFGACWASASEPAPESDTGSVSIRLHLTDEALPGDNPNAAVWDTIPPSEFQLAPQVHWPDRIQEVTVKSFKVRGMHNGEELAMLLEYKDPSKDAADAAAVEFMVGDRKAHFAHGQEMLQVEGGPVNIWYWKNAAGKAVDMSAKGFTTLRPQTIQNVSATGAWREGVWRVVFSRRLNTDDANDVQITPGEWANVAFAFWDGQIVDGVVKERGSQKAISSWWYVRAEPTTDDSIYGYVALGIALAAGFEWLLVRKIRRGNTA